MGKLGIHLDNHPLCTPFMDSVWPAPQKSWPQMWPPPHLGINFIVNQEGEFLGAQSPAFDLPSGKIRLGKIIRIGKPANAIYKSTDPELESFQLSIEHWIEQDSNAFGVWVIDRYPPGIAIVPKTSNSQLIFRLNTEEPGDPYGKMPEFYQQVLHESADHYHMSFGRKLDVDAKSIAPHTVQANYKIGLQNLPAGKVWYLYHNTEIDRFVLSVTEYQIFNNTKSLYLDYGDQMQFYPNADGFVEVELHFPADQSRVIENRTFYFTRSLEELIKLLGFSFSSNVLIIQPITIKYLLSTFINSVVFLKFTCKPVFSTSIAERI